MAILLISTIGPMTPWIERLSTALPDEDVRSIDAPGTLGDIEIAVLAPPRPGLFATLPNLRLVISLRAGVDDLLADAGLSPEVPICRAQQTGGDKMIDEYALLHVLRHHRHMPDFIAAQASGEWINPGVIPAEERNVGFLGLGVIGLSVARRVRDLGFPVAAWTRTARTEPGIEIFHGADALGRFLARTEILINLLAVTPETTNILNAGNLALLPQGASVINLGRGEHVVDADLIAALDRGHLSAATLDVFRTEPLPSDHPFWAHPRITVMPHTARRPQAANIIPQAIENIRRFRAGEPLLQAVDRARGY